MGGAAVGGIHVRLHQVQKPDSSLGGGPPVGVEHLGDDPQRLPHQPPQVLFVGLEIGATCAGEEVLEVVCGVGVGDGLCELYKRLVAWNNGLVMGI